MRCRGINKDGSRCKVAVNKRYGDFMCGHHRNQGAISKLRFGRTHSIDSSRVVITNKKGFQIFHMDDHRRDKVVFFGSIWDIEALGTEELVELYENEAVDRTNEWKNWYREHNLSWSGEYNFTTTD